MMMTIAHDKREKSHWNDQQSQNQMKKGICQIVTSHNRKGQNDQGGQKAMNRTNYGENNTQSIPIAL